MAKFEIVMPRLGESIIEATITKWLKNPGDRIAEDDALAEIATDKVDSEIPSPVEGILEKLLFQEGDTVEVGKTVALIQTTREEQNNENIAESDKRPHTPDEKLTQDESQIDENLIISKGESGRFYSPLVRNIAKQEKLTMSDLDAIPGSGKEGRVTKEDLLAYLQKRKKDTSSPGQEIISNKIPATAKTHTTPDLKTGPGDEVFELSRLRKLIADHMVASKETSVHVTSIAEFDVTNLVKWRDKYKKIFEAREGEKLTFTPIFIWAIARTIKDYPMINASLIDNRIIVRKNVNIGMATALPDGNLIVPVIKNADHKSLTGLAKSVNDLANRARLNKLLPDEIQGGTYTITNLGTFDTLFATPIINQPQVAILGTGAIKKKPVVIESEKGDSIAIRSMIYLSMSYDHRIIDGALGGMVLRQIGRYLENWDITQTI
jgi:2-oxoglutarate dehydrogenase E2 component (dihydrolipoamide succinyltransferase)